MLHRCDYDVITRLQLRTSIALRDEVDALCGALGENDLAAGGSVYEASDFLAHDIISLRGPLAQVMDTPMDIGVLSRVEAGHRIDHTLRLLTRGRVIEVDQGLASNAPAKNREVGANALEIEWRG
jgi:hypothetical protein